MDGKGKDVSDPTCRAFVKGNCRKGAKCRWLHKVNQKSTSENVATGRMKPTSVKQNGTLQPGKMNTSLSKKRGWISSEVQGINVKKDVQPGKRQRPTPRDRGINHTTTMYGGSGSWSSNKWLKKFTKPLRPSLQKAHRELGPDWWVYDPDSGCFRHTRYRSYEFDPIFETPSFMYYPDTEQYFSEQTKKYYELKDGKYVTVPKRTFKKQVFLEEYKQMLTEFIKVVSKSGVPRCQLNSQVAMWRARQEQLYSEKTKMRSPTEEIIEVTNELLNGHLGLVDHLGKRLCVKPPYTCPLCGRKSTDADTLLAHFKLHEACNKAGRLTSLAKKNKNQVIQALLESEAVNVVGDSYVQKAIRQAMSRSGKNSGRRFHVLNTLKKGLNLQQNETLGCEVLHPVRSAFPEAHGCYFGKHVCEITTEVGNDP